MRPSAPLTVVGTSGRYIGGWREQASGYSHQHHSPPKHGATRSTRASDSMVGCVPGGCRSLMYGILLRMKMVGLRHGFPALWSWRKHVEAHAMKQTEHQRKPRRIGNVGPQHWQLVVGKAGTRQCILSIEARATGRAIIFRTVKQPGAHWQ
jgi:hypothetical protein